MHAEIKIALYAFESTVNNILNFAMHRVQEHQLRLGYFESWFYLSLCWECFVILKKAKGIQLFALNNISGKTILRPRKSRVFASNDNNYTITSSVDIRSFAMTLMLKYMK